MPTIPYLELGNMVADYKNKHPRDLRYALVSIADLDACLTQVRTLQQNAGADGIRIYLATCLDQNNQALYDQTVMIAVPTTNFTRRNAFPEADDCVDNNGDIEVFNFGWPNADSIGMCPPNCGATAL